VHFAALYNQPVILTELLAKDAKIIDLVNREHQSPLIVASDAGAHEVTSVLIENGCDLDIRDSSQMSAYLRAENRFPLILEQISAQRSATFVIAVS
jgi:ankyrin repeat protein